ncbi:hypothetical protein AAIB41_00470 [Brucella sp. BE17]|uniref:hypothetical protein n=1 Tax=Brucella sp. BE17 TaxID=3142977 RepID=UPI0031BB42EE
MKKYVMPLIIGAVFLNSVGAYAKVVPASAPMSYPISAPAGGHAPKILKVLSQGNKKPMVAPLGAFCGFDDSDTCLIYCYVCTLCSAPGEKDRWSGEDCHAPQQ